MALHHRVHRLERDLPDPGGRLRCKVCADGTRATGVVVRIMGVDQGPRPQPCPGCGRDEPEELNYFLAVPPKGWTPHGKNTTL